MDPIELLEIRALWLEWRRTERVAEHRDDQFRIHATRNNADAAVDATQRSFEAFVKLVQRIA
jgi:hypothetical protein